MKTLTYSSFVLRIENESCELCVCARAYTCVSVVKKEHLYWHKYKSNLRSIIIIIYMWHLGNQTKQIRAVMKFFYKLYEKSSIESAILKYFSAPG